MALCTGVTAAVFVVCLLGFESDVQPWAGLGAIVGFFSFWIFWVFAIGWFAVSIRTARDHPLPPRPVPLPDPNAELRQQFENQNALGKARFATPAEVDAALSRKQAPPPPRRFQD